MMNSPSKIIIGVLLFMLVFGTGSLFVSSMLGNVNDVDKERYDTKFLGGYELLNNKSRDLQSAISSTNTNNVFGFLDAFIKTGWYAISGLSVTFNTIFGTCSDNPVTGEEDCTGIFGALSQEFGVPPLVVDILTMIIIFVVVFALIGAVFRVQL